MPNSWILCKFGEIVKIRRGASPRPIKQHLTTDKNGINWIKIGDVLPGEVFINSTKQKIKKESAKFSVFLNKGALILSNSMSFGRPYILNIDGCIHDGWLAIEIYNNTINKEYLQYILQGYMWYFNQKATGTGVDNLNINRVYEMPFALPPLSEQERILDKLRKIDDIFKKYNLEIKNFDNIKFKIKKRILDSIFSENSSYKSYYENRISTNLEEYIGKSDIGDGDWVLSENMDDKGNIKLVQLKHIGSGNYIDKPYCKINNSFFEQNKCSEIKEDYLLINRLVSDKMNVCIMPNIQSKCITSVDVCWIKPNKRYLTKYLMYYLMAPCFQKEVLNLCSGSTRKRISKKNLIKIPMLIHSFKDQKEIVKKIDNIFTLIDNM